MPLTARPTPANARARSVRHAAHSAPIRTDRARGRPLTTPRESSVTIRTRSMGRHVREPAHGAPMRAVQAGARVDTDGERAAGAPGARARLRLASMRVQASPGARPKLMPSGVVGVIDVRWGGATVAPPIPPIK